MNKNEDEKHIYTVLANRKSAQKMAQRRWHVCDIPGLAQGTYTGPSSIVLLGSQKCKHIFESIIFLFFFFFFFKVL